MADLVQTLLRFNLQPCSLAKPFNEMAVGFYIHTEMNFVVSKRRSDDEKAAVRAASDKNEFGFDAGAL